jgi:hypothetical protein
MVKCRSAWKAVSAKGVSAMKVVKLGQKQATWRMRQVRNKMLVLGAKAMSAADEEERFQKIEGTRIGASNVTMDCLDPPASGMSIVVSEESAKAAGHAEEVLAKGTEAAAAAKEVLAGSARATDDAELPDSASMDSQAEERCGGTAVVSQPNAASAVVCDSDVAVAAPAIPRKGLFVFGAQLQGRRSKKMVGSAGARGRPSVGKACGQALKRAFSADMPLPLAAFEVARAFHKRRRLCA